MKRETKIIAKWILYAILLTLAFVLIFFYLSSITKNVSEHQKIINDIKKICEAVMLFYWCFGIMFGLKLCAGELEKLKSEKKKFKKKLK